MIRPQSHLMPDVGYGPIPFGVLGMDYTDDPAVGERRPIVPPRQTFCCIFEAQMT